MGGKEPGGRGTVRNKVRAESIRAGIRSSKQMEKKTKCPRLTSQVKKIRKKGGLMLSYFLGEEFIKISRDHHRLHRT